MTRVFFGYSRYWVKFPSCNLLLAALLLMLGSVVEASGSTCYGTTSRGKLENGVALPASGANFESYTFLSGILGRNYVHSTVRDIIVESYRDLHKNYPGKLYKYAETGFQQGGKFKPHKTHQNGLSVDFAVPVKKSGKSAYLPTNVFNKWGYDIEFDKQGRYRDYVIDYEAMAAHIVSLYETATRHGVKIWRVIFDPGLQRYLYQTREGVFIKKHIFIPKKKSWVRHDDHYHVDFIVKCKPLQ